MAFLYYKVAASLKSEGALLKLGECYKTGFGVESDLNKAINYYKPVSETNKEALVKLGYLIFDSGRSTRKVDKT